ncbi:hypothetical protein CDD82_1573 [Ophiocordyceps australis]|uniref:Peptidyl-prolyl cis-trans isomerase-like 2 n=1 Tax=Ophiocordyceps australis TaxID=1399860 RepID=A0A2C5Y9M9_9HYPO|nr:hypothetical protein CDD82_1573 [Ophiocordyceps australis]
MGKGTDKLYITHSEWSSSDAYSASVGANASDSSRRGTSSGHSFRRLPFNFCAASLQPFKDPVCTPEGIIFDLDVIQAWLDSHPHQNPIDGKPLLKENLIRLHFARNAQSDSLGAGLSDGKGDLIDPVTYKVLTDNTHIVAIRHGNYANVFAWDTVERMNIKAKMWRDLVDDEAFTRADIITLQDPQNAASRNLDDFKFLNDGHEVQQTKQQQQQLQEGNINTTALGSMADKVLRPKTLSDQARKTRQPHGEKAMYKGLAAPPARPVGPKATIQEKKMAPNAAAYTTGRAAASFTSTGLTPVTSGERALLSEEEVMLKPRRIKTKGYVSLETNMGKMTLELYPETAPKAVWNFIKLAQKGYYKDVPFHRNVAGFMIQGGDPSGTGRAGSSIWGKYFNDELEGPLTHNKRGIVSMANKGKNTNSSQFFIIYKPTPHLDRKHTIFGCVEEGTDVLSKMEAVPTDGSSRPLNKIVIKDIVVLMDPFEEFQLERRQEERRQQKLEEVRRQGGTEDDKTTWTGKRIRGHDTLHESEEPQGVGKYLKAVMAAAAAKREADKDTGGHVDTWEEPVKKKFKPSGFGNFEGW